MESGVRCKACGIGIVMMFALWMSGCGGSSSGGGTEANSLGQTSSTDARYTVTFQATWGPATHDEVPSGAHFSPLVGAVHNAGVKFWEPGTVASRGIEVMAETGGTGPLISEVEAAIQSGGAGSVLHRSGAFNSPNTVSFTFEISRDFPLVTLVSMVAPSPDWFVGVRDLDLQDGDGWIDRMTVDLFAYDAGSDSGESFTARNADTRPRENISRLTTGAFEVNGRIPRLGTFTFVRN